MDDPVMLAGLSGHYTQSSTTRESSSEETHSRKQPECPHVQTPHPEPGISNRPDSPVLTSALTSDRHISTTRNIIKELRRIFDKLEEPLNTSEPPLNDEEALRLFRNLFQNLEQTVAIVRKHFPEVPVPTATYASVAAQAGSLATPPPPINPGSLDAPRTHPPSHEPKDPAPKKPVCSQEPTSKKPPAMSMPPNQLIVHIAGQSDVFFGNVPNLKEPTAYFAELSSGLKFAAPGCVPLKLHLSRIGNLVITFTPATPRSLLMSKLEAVRTALRLTPTIPITYNTPRTTIHLANVPTRISPASPVFDRAALAESVLTNPDLAGLTLTSHPRWLRHPSTIDKPRSSVVLTFEDPDGSIGKRILKARLCVFGSPVTPKPWTNRPPPKRVALAPLI